MVMETEVVYFCFADFDVMGVSYTTSSILDFKLSHFVNHFVWGALYSGQNWSGRPNLTTVSLVYGRPKPEDLILTEVNPSGFI